MKRAMPAALAAIALLLVAAFVGLLAATVARAAPLTTTPDVIYLFVVMVPPSPGRLPYEELWRTTDKAACEDQVADWATKKVPAACLPHRQRKLKSEPAIDD